MDTAHVRAICEAAMREFGVPDRIRTDNGAPFSGTALLGLSRLSLEWHRLGVVHERIQPGKPQQTRFDEFRRVYNHERPHEALGNDTPASLYVPSTRLLPRYTRAHVYPAHFATRRVNDAGDIQLAQEQSLYQRGISR